MRMGRCGWGGFRRAAVVFAQMYSSFSLSTVVSSLNNGVMMAVGMPTDKAPTCPHCPGLAQVKHRLVSVRVHSVDEILAPPPLPEQERFISIESDVALPWLISGFSFYCPLFGVDSMGGVSP